MAGKSSKRPVLTTFVILLGMIFLFGVVEAGLRIHAHFFPESPRVNTTMTILPRATERDARVRVFEQWVDGKVIRNWRETNQGPLRLAPAIAGAPSKHAIFFGDADTFGQGVSDDETYPYYFSTLNKGFKSLNFGIRGGSVASALHIYDQLPLRDPSLPKEGFAAYFFFKHPQIIRLRPFLLRKELFRPDEPFYELDENKKVQFVGVPQETQPWLTGFFRLFWDLESSSLLFKHEVKSLEQDRARFTPDDEALAIELLVQLAQRYRADFPQGRFFVITNDEEDDFYGKLQARGVEVVFLDLSDLRESEFLQPYGNFRNANGNRELARRLSEATKKNRAQP